MSSWSQPTDYITHVNSAPTPDMPTFFTAISRIPGSTRKPIHLGYPLCTDSDPDFRLGIMNSGGVPSVLSMKTCQHYFPNTEWIKDPSACEGWRTVVHNQTTGQTI